MKPKGMTDAPKSAGILFGILCVYSFLNECSSSKISDLRLCGDKECKTTLSYGRTLAKHVQNDQVFLNFERNEMLEITSKSAGDRPDLWGGRLNGKTGYFPRSFVREYKVENPSPQFIVPTEISEGKTVVIEEKPAKVPDKAEEGTEVDDTEDQDDTEVEDEDDDVWWEDDEDKESTDKATQKDQEKPATPPSSASKEKEEDKKVEEVKVTQPERKNSEDVKVTESQNADNPKEGGVAEEKVESKEPAVSDEKDPTEIGEAKEGNGDTEKKTVEDSGSQIHVKKENRVKELLDELRESLYSLHDIDDKDKLNVNELNKMLQEGSAKQQPETTDGQPPPAVDSKTELNQEKSDDATPDTNSQEDVKLPGLSDLLKDTPEDALKSPQDDKSLEKDDTEIADETEIGNEESSTEQKQETQEDAGKEDSGKHPGGIPVSDVEDLPPSQQEQIKKEIQPSSVKQEKVEETPLLSSFTEKMSTTPSSEVKASSSSHTPGLTEVPSSVTESSTVVEASQQTEMAGYTIIDGTPFPLDMFEDPTATERVVDQTESVVEQTKPGTFSSTQSQVDSSSVSPDKTVKSPATEKLETQSTLQSQSSESSVMPSQTEILSESVLVDSGSPADVVPTQTDTGSKSTAVKKEDDTESTVQVDTEVGASEEDKPKQVEDTKQLDVTDLEKSVESKKEEIKRTEESIETKEDPKVEDQIQEKVDTPEATEKESLTNISNSEEKVNENEQKSQESDTQNDKQTGRKEEDKKQDDVKESKEKAEEPNLSVLKFLDDEEISSEVPSSDENVKEMEIPSEEVKAEKENKQEQLSQEITEKPIQEQTTASAVPSTSPTEQLMSSMEIDYSVETKTVIDDTRNTDIIGNQQNATQTVVETDNLKLELPTTMDAYATADFLSRKPLSHEPHTESSQSQNPNEKLEVKEKGGDEIRKETVTQASPETTKTESTAATNLGETKSEPVTVSPLESTTLSGFDEGEIPPPPTESKETATQPSTGQSSEEPLVTAKEDKEDLKPTTEETAGVTESTTQGEQTTTGSYDQEDFFSRKINDGDLEEKEDLAYKAERSWMKGDQFFRGVISKLPPSLQALLEQEPLGLSPQMTILVTMVTLATLMGVTCFSVVCGGGRKSKKQDPVVVVRGLEEKLFILTKEKENLEDELNALQQKMQDTEEDTKSTQSSVSTIQKDLQTLQLHNNALKEEIETFKEENTTMKQELSAKSKELKSKDNQLKELEKQIKQKDEKYNKTNDKCKEATKEVQEKAGEIKTLKSQIHSLTEQVSHLEANKSQLSEEANVWSEKVHELTEQLDYVKGEQKQMAEDLAYKENEIEVLRDCFLQLKAFQDQVGEEGEEGEGSRDETDSGNIESKLKSMMNVSEVSAKLKAAEEEKNSLENRLEIEMQSRRDMEERILDLERKAESLNSDKMKAERQNSEAQTKLEVLSNYFKQKELELQRELGEQEALKKMNINKLENSDTRTKMMQEELDGSKAQVEDLKREILSAERDFRSQIAANEKKAHENWLAARAAERELKESRHEASVLRQKLTDLERRLMQGPPGGLIRPVPSRGMPPPGMLNGPPPPGMERPGSRGRLPPTGPRDEDFPGSPGPDPERRPLPPLGPDDRRIPPFNPDDRRMPFPDDRRIPPMEGPDRRQTPMGSRVPPPHPMDMRSPPPFDRRPPPPLDRRSPPPYERGLRLPPPPLDRRSPGQRMPFPPDMPPPHLRGPPRGPLSPPLRNDGHGIDTPPYRPPHDPDREPRQQSQV